MDHGSMSRVTRSKDQAKANYDRLSKFYEALAGSSERPSLDLGLQILDIKKGETVLEIGFGPGESIVEMAKRVGENGKVYGIDISEGMLEIAQNNVRNAGLSNRTILKLGEATDLSFDKDSFDAIFMGFVLELFDTPEIPKVLSECWRVLKNGGRICVVSLSKDNPPKITERMYEWSHKHFPVLIDCRPIYVRDALEDAGFQIIDTEMKNMWGLKVEIVLAKESK
jgi:ubiquinone/menaquinone biosynthesis C-methylase UbiE